MVAVDGEERSHGGKIADRGTIYEVFFGSKRDTSVFSSTPCSVQERTPPLENKIWKKIKNKLKCNFTPYFE
jgi:hypothetical protein